MKILAIISSAMHEGSGAQITRAICEKAALNGAEVEYVYLYDMNFKSCGSGNCKIVSGDPFWCDKQDDLVPVLKKLIDADVLVWSAPIYMGYICGTSKTFFDRFCIFVNEDFTINRISGKKYVLIFTSGAPTETYKAVMDNISTELTEFFKMEKIGTILAGGLMKSGQPLPDDLLKQTHEIAQKLC